MGIETILFVFGLIIVIAIYVAVKKSKGLKQSQRGHLVPFICEWMDRIEPEKRITHFRAR
jgi:hypothetical protein